MSPTIPILSALLLLLISGSTEGVPKMSPTALLRQTFRYWRKIYNTYHEELALGYCWADYLFKIRNELSTNLSALSLATTGDRSNTTVGATKSQQNPFPQNAMADATMLRETQRGKHLREKRSHAMARSSISRFTNNPDGYKIVLSTKIIQEQGKWVVNQARQALSIILYHAKENNNKIDGNKKTTPMIDSHVEERRHALTIVPELFHNEELRAPRGHKFSSHGMSSRVVNPAPNPEDDDKVGFGSMDQEDARRKVLRPNRHGSFVEGGFGPRSFSLKVSCGRRARSLDDHQFPFRRWPLPRKRNSRVDEPLSDPGTSEEDYRIRTDPVRRRVPLNNDGSSSTPSRSHFRRANAERRRMVVVKLMDFEENSSCDPVGTINSKTPHRKLEELSRDSLLSPRGTRIAVTERSSLEFRGSEGEAIKRKVSPRFEMTGGSDTKKRCYQQPRREEKRSRTGRDVLKAPAAIHPYFRGVERLHQQMLYENWSFFPVRRTTIPRGSRPTDNLRTVRSVPSLPLVRFIDYEDLIQSVHNSRPRNRDQLSPVQPPSFVSSLSSIIISVFRTLGMFVEVGRQIIDVVESNSALACTKEYLWTKIIRWIDG